MKDRAGHERENVIVPALRRLEERCRELGVAIWHWDAAGVRLSGPEATGEAGAWLDAAAELGGLAGLAVAHPRTEPSAVHTLFPGCWALVLGTPRGRGRSGASVALALSAEALRGREHAAVCERAGLNPAAAAGALGPFARHRAEDIAGLVRVLVWMRDDLLQCAKDQDALAGFSGQLTEMYEEIGLLYRLGQSMNRISTPEEFVRTTCQELAQTLPFGWIAVGFGDARRVSPGLVGRLLVEGSLPIAQEEMAALTRGLVAEMAPDRWVLLPEGSASGIAATVGSQVLAHPIAREGQVVGVLMAGNKAGEDNEVSSFETQLLDAAADFLGVFVENAGLYADQRALFVGMIEALIASIDAKDRYTCGHSERVAYLASRLAASFGMEPEEVERIRLSGLLHDVGKIGVPEAVLCKRGRLTDEEFEQIKLHPEIGHRILKDIPFMEDILPGVMHHHERWDGAGYPSRLAGEEIPLVARLLGVADSFDAMSSTRSYRAAMPRDKVLAEIGRCAGSQFDPVLADLFVKLDFAEYDRMVERHAAEQQASPHQQAA